MEKFIKEIKDVLVGKKITDIRYMTVEEADEYMWDKRPVIIELDHTDLISPQADDEGNNGGALATTFEKLPLIPTL